MPDGRFVSRSIAHNEQLAGVSLEAAFLFVGCIPHLDREGRLTGNPQLVKAVAVPLRAEITTERIPALLAELVSVGLILQYAADGRQVIAFPSFEKHQRGMKKNREAPSKFPAPPDATPALRSQSGAAPDEIGSGSGVNRDEVAPSEVKLSEVKLSQVRPPPPPACVRGREGFLASLPPSERRDWWEAEIDTWRDGLNLQQPASDADIDQALTDYLALPERDYSKPHVRRFVQRATRDRLRPPAPSAGPQRGAGGRRPTPQQYAYDTSGNAAALAELGIVPQEEPA